MLRNRSWNESSLTWGAGVAGAWWSFGIVLLLAAQSSGVEVSWTATTCLCVSLFIGAVTFGLFAYDKHQAQTEGRRIAEFTLHVFTLLGGWSGAFLARYFFRHKTQKGVFHVIGWCGFAIHLLALLAWWTARD